MKEQRWFPVFFMFVATALCSSIVIGLTLATRAKVQANETMALEAAVLRALPGLYDESLSKTDLHRLFTDRITPPSVETGGAWTVRENGIVTAYAVPVAGQGFWAPIRGILGVAGDGRTVTGIAFYEQNETPGLGAEIETPAWRGQFAGKVLGPGDRAMDIKRPGEPLGENGVHAVTGATQTSVRVEKLINDSLAQWRRNMAGGE